MTMNDEWKKIWTKAVVAYFKVLFQYLTDRIERSY
jgi:hypothetical protein